MKIPINNHTLLWRGGGMFRPEGAFDLVCCPSLAKSNPIRWDSKESWAARIVVGFKREGKRPVTMNRLVKLVRKIRLEQVGDPGASFLAQRGLYRHDAGGIVDEPGAQVIIFNTSDTPPKAFEKQIERLSEDVATELGQESVIVEIQRNGLVRRTFSMGRR